MIRVTLPTRVLGISFKHQSAMKVVGHVPMYPKAVLGAPIKQEIRTTACEIYELVGEDARLIGHSVAECSPLDNFTKATGRKIALTKALAWMKMPKDERAVVWGVVGLKVNGVN